MTSTFTSGGVMTAPTISGACGVSDGVGTWNTNREGGAASGRKAERPDADIIADLPALLERAQTGDQDAFAAIYEQYHRPIYIYVARRVTGQQTAEDVTHDVFVNALRGLRHVDWLNRDLGAWLFTIAHNAVVDHHRSAYVRREVLDVDVVDTCAPDTTDGSVLSAELWAAVRRLSDDDRKLVAFRFLSDLSVAETAVLLGVCGGTVKSRTNRVINALRADLGTYVMEALS